ncbi:MAG: hypothetical protein F6J93_24720 [Oscillatoria sp. SIO1A7]|nr:hypothetical protein [Oscillatoria sp. SIO1A7]
MPDANMPNAQRRVWGVGCREWCRELIISPKSSSSPKPSPHPTPYTLIREPNARCEHAQCPKKGVGCGVWGVGNGVGS